MAEDPSVTNDDEIDLEALIGNVLESRGYTSDRASKLDTLDSLGDNLGKKVEELFRSNLRTPDPGGNSGPSFDQDGFLAKVGEMVDAKLSQLAPGTVPPPATKKTPFLQRVLGVKT